jgi:thiol-disulfide isomerase/thioredoxin
MKMKKLAIVLCSFITVGLFGQTSVPDIDVKDMEGNNVSFKSAIDTNKLTIVSFWATWCGPCIKELEAINEVYEEWQTEYNVDLIAVSIDDSRNSKKVKPKVLGLGWEYTVLLDENSDLARAMNVVNPPMLFVINQKGKVVYTHAGYSPGSEDELEEKLGELKTE